MMTEFKEDVLNKIRSLLEGSRWQTESDITSKDIVRLLDIIYNHTMESPR